MDPVEQPKRQRGRPPVRQVAVRDELRRALLSGRWKPGERLPPRLRLVRDLQTTSSTLQSALDDLISEGQIVARGARGTFIAEAPPYRNRFALVLPAAPDRSRNWSRLWQALSLVAGRPRADGRVIAEFHGSHRSFVSPSLDRLFDECARNLFAGLILVVPPPMIAGTPLASARIPRVFLSNGPVPAPDALLRFDHASFRRLAIASLVRRGCRRIAVLGGAGQFAESGPVAAWQRDVAAAGLETRSSWFLPCDLEYPAPAWRLVRLLLSHAGDRPDGLIIADDNLLPAIGSGITAEGLTAGRDIHLVAHANFPLPSEADIPVERIGFDAAEAIDRAVAYCLAQPKKAAKGSIVIAARAEA